MPVSALNVSKLWKKNELTRWLIFFSIAIIFTILDLTTKYLTYQIDPIDIIPGVLEFRFISNKGIIWGLFSQGSLLFIVISALAIPLIIFMFKYIYVFVGHGTKQKDNVQPSFAVPKPLLQNGEGLPLTPVNNDAPTGLAKYACPVRDDKPLDIAREAPAPLEAISKFTPLERTQPEDKDISDKLKYNTELSNGASTNTNEVISNIVPTNFCRDNEVECRKNLLPPEMPIREFSMFSIIGVLTIACGLILAGAIGNLYDRIFFEGVRDFISFYIINWPIFNLADVYITIGAFLIIFCMFKKPLVTRTNSMDDNHGA